MKVLDYGHIRPYYSLCSGCGATLEFDKRDIKNSNKCDARGPSYDKYVVCPVCNKIIYEHSWRKFVEDL